MERGGGKQSHKGPQIKYRPKAEDMLDLLVPVETPVSLTCILDNFYCTQCSSTCRPSLLALRLWLLLLDLDLHASQLATS